VKLTATRAHVLVTEKYGSLTVSASVELDSEVDGFDLESQASEVLDKTLNPAIERLNRSLDIPGDEEFVRAWVQAGAN
jgi:hypothetical protein